MTLPRGKHGRWALMVLLGLLVLGPMASSHEGAEVSAYPTRVAPGETLFVEGVDINPNGPIAIFLEGLKGKFRLGQVQGDPDGGFKTNVAIPPDVPPGTYLLKAIGANGVSATFDLTLTAGQSSATQEPREATDALMALERPKSPGTLTIGLVLVGLSLILGGWLIRPERRAPPRAVIGSTPHRKPGSQR